MHARHLSYVSLNCTQKINFFLFSCKTAKKGKDGLFFVRKIIERISELRLKYNGFHSSDKVPQLTKSSFASIISAVSIVRGLLF